MYTMGMKLLQKNQDIDYFKTQLAKYKYDIDKDIELFSSKIIPQTCEEFGEYSAESMKIFCDVLSRGGKRIRGALTIMTYEMHGGKDRQLAIEAARIMEILQAYLLIVDDVQDKSKTRRGKPTAHLLFEELHQNSNWKGDPHHFGESLAFNSGLIACHLAMELATSLNVSDRYLVEAIKCLNSNLRISGQGQANDIFNEVSETTSIDRIDNVLLWKTAYYTFTNPMQFGAILAGATEEQREVIYDFSVHAGRAFQITDDVLGIYGDEFESGKSPMDDLREGKRTLLIYYALQNSPKEDSYFIERMLGNHELTQADFRKCKDIIFRSGALQKTKDAAEDSVVSAQKIIIEKLNIDYPEQSKFLNGLLGYLLTRQS